MLFVYYRLASGTTQIENFAQINPYFNDDKPSNVTINGIDFIEDFVEQRQFMYEKEIGSVIS